MLLIQEPAVTEAGDCTSARVMFQVTLPFPITLYMLSEAMAGHPLALVRLSDFILMGQLI